MEGPDGEATLAPRSEQTSCKHCSLVSRQQPSAGSFWTFTPPLAPGASFLPQNHCSTAVAQRECVRQPCAVSGCTRSPTPCYPVSWLMAQALAPAQCKRQVSKSPQSSWRLSDVNVLIQASVPGKGGRPDHSSRNQGCPELGCS